MGIDDVNRRLLLLVPTRGRPDNVARLLDALRKTCSGRTTVVFGLDSDDPRKDATLEHVYEAISFNVDERRAGRRPSFHVMAIESGEHRGVVCWLNYLALMFLEDETRAQRTVVRFPWIGTIGDDNVPRTPGWDALVIGSLERQGTGLCFGDDRHPGRQPGSLCCHVFMTSDIVRELGYMGPPCLRHMYVDDVWMQWGKATSIEFLADVDMEHLHPSAGKSSSDETYETANANVLVDERTYRRYGRYDLVRDVAAIRSLRGARRV